MLKDPPEAAGPQQPPARQLKNEIVWFPGAMLLLTIQMLLLMRGLRPSLSWQAHAAFVSSLWLVGASVLFMLLSAARETVLLRSFALVTLVIAVAADIFVATSAASGSIPEGMAMALLTVVMWATIWSITASR